MLPVTFLVNLQSYGFVGVLRVRGLQPSMIHTVCNVHDDIIRRGRPSPNLDFTSIFFYAQFGGELPNLKTANISGYVVTEFLDNKTVLGQNILHCVGILCMRVRLVFYMSTVILCTIGENIC